MMNLSIMREWGKGQESLNSKRVSIRCIHFYTHKWTFHKVKLPRDHIHDFDCKLKLERERESL